MNLNLSFFLAKIKINLVPHSGTRARSDGINRSRSCFATSIVIILESQFSSSVYPRSSGGADRATGHLCTIITSELDLVVFLTVVILSKGVTSNHRWFGWFLSFCLTDVSICSVLRYRIDATIKLIDIRVFQFLMHFQLFLTSSPFGQCH